MALAFALALAGCTIGAQARLLRAVPQLDEELARHLVQSDDSTLVRFCREAGWVRIYPAMVALHSARDLSSPEAFARSESVVRLPARRLANAIGQAFGLHGQSRATIALLDAPFEIRYERWRLGQRARRIAADSGLTIEARIERLGELLELCDTPPIARERCRSGLLLTMANLDDRLDAGARDHRFRRMALAILREGGFQPPLCQELGALGGIKARMDQPDSAAQYWNEGLELARRHALVDQELRFLSFFAQHHAGRGRWALAASYFREARRVSREKARHGEGLRPLLESLEHPEALGQWDVVARDLRAAGVDLRRARRSRFYGTPFYESRLLELQAVSAAHAGDMRGAERLFEQALGHDRTVSGARSPTRARLLARYARALLWNGRPADAVRISREGLRHCDAEKIPEHVPELALLLARGLFAQGNHASCAPALERFRQTASRVPGRQVEWWTEADALAARLAWASGDDLALQRALRDGLDRLESRLTSLRPRPENYRLFEGPNPLRQLLHDLARDRPDIGLDIDRVWRRAPELLGRGSSRGVLAGCADILLRERAAQPVAAGHVARTGAAAGDGMLLAYYLGDPIVRWTRIGEEIRRDELPLSRRELEAAIERVVRGLSRTPGDANEGIDRALQMDLAWLSDRLLPNDVRRASPSIRWLQVLPDGALSRLPFEALPIGSAEYRPLAADWNVVYLRGTGRAGAGSRGGPTVLLSDPLLSPALARRLGNPPKLPFATREAALLERMDPSIRHLTGTGATKAALELAWKRAGTLFFATHVVEDPETPLARFLPLAPDTSRADETGEVLELADVLGADLSRCELVVLSGCATGASATGGPAAGPSLAEAFLDAGAGTVIHTAWPVRDDHAEAVMTAFIRSWKERGQPPAVALCEARRRLAADGDGFRHPSTWAAYRISLQSPVNADRRAGLTAR